MWAVDVKERKARESWIAPSLVPLDNFLIGKRTPVSCGGRSIKQLISPLQPSLVPLNHKTKIIASLVRFATCFAGLVAYGHSSFVSQRSSGEVGSIPSHHGSNLTAWDKRLALNTTTKCEQIDCK